MNTFDILNNCFDKYKLSFKEIADQLERTAINDNTRITIGDHYTLANTPIYIVLELFVNGYESEDDYGLCLVVSYQYYDPSSDIMNVSSDKLWITGDLSKGTGETISSMPVVSLDITKEDTPEKLEKIYNSTLEFVKNQVPVMIETVKSDY